MNQLVLNYKYKLDQLHGISKRQRSKQSHISPQFGLENDLNK